MWTDKEILTEGFTRAVTIHGDMLRLREVERIQVDYCLLTTD
jgi:hypothetical protein